MIVAFALAIYIMLLAYRNDKFQNNIISLNAKILQDSIEKDKFYSIVSHDIMNPFNALLGFSKILKEAVKEGDHEEVEECSVIVHQSAERISNLLQNLLVWSRVQNGKIQFTPKNHNVNQLVSEAMAVVAPIAKNKTITLDWKVEGEINALLDKNMITSVIQNIVTNAIKFTPKGGQVKVSASSESTKLKVVVSDTGVGMNEEQLSKLFRLDKASSSKGTDEETGTGLGLIIAREFIEKHNGKIWAESELGKGSKFCFDIPLGK
jgi:signal transduction histidine kinase